MILYRPGDDVGPLEHWPFDAPSSDYRITRGAPRAYGRLDAGGPGHLTRQGIWRCTEGAFDCTEQGDEMMVILSGQCVLTDLEKNERWTLKTGDGFMTRDGARVNWDIKSDLIKAVFAYKSGGY